MKTSKRDKGKLLGNPTCPVCEKRIDGFTHFEDKDVVPKEGDISICIYCATPLMVVRDKWARMTGADLEQAMADRRFVVALAMVKTFRKERLG